MGRGHLTAIAVGTVLGGAASGVAVGGGMEEGDDAVIIMDLLGTVLGAYRMARAWTALTGHRVEVTGGGTRDIEVPP